MATTRAPSYFVDHKKGEVNELKVLLRNMTTERDPNKKIPVIKKVIAYMTLGIDVSQLFSEMVLAANNRNLVIKKMVFQYLVGYASTHPDLTLLAINTLQKDSRDEDPMVRGLALRSLCSLKLPSVLEYVMVPLKASLTDSSAYVRKTGVMGVMKVYALSPGTIKDSDLVDTMYNMIRDRDPQVVANCIMVLNELMKDDGGIAINQAIIHHLMNRIRDFNEWSQCVVLDLVAKYTASTKDETFQLMNLLDPCLRVSNASVVIAACNAFITLTNRMPSIQQKVYSRLKTPLLTLMAAATPEMCYCVLSHIVLIVPHCPGVFDSEFKQFFCRYNEPTHVRHIKMDVLAMLANDGSVGEILSELSEYVSDVDADMARHAIRAIAQVVVRYPEGADRVIGCLLELAELDIDYVRAETVIVVKDLLRKYPSRATDVLPSLQSCLKSVDEPQAKAAVVWMFGEFGQLIENAPYALEPLIDGIAEEQSNAVRLALLTSTMKLFFKRAPEVQAMLGRLLKCCLEDGSSSAVHDRALLYYRLLRQGIDEAKAVVGDEPESVTAFLEEQNNELKERIYKEFNTLAVVYNEPSVNFINEEYRFAPNNAEVAPFADDGPAEQVGAGAGAAEVGAGPAAAPGGDLLGLGGGEAPAKSGGAWQLVPNPVLAPADFQAKWMKLPGSSQTSSIGRIPTNDEVTGVMATSSIGCIATGDTGAQLKFFFFGQDSAGAFHLVEMVIDKASHTVTTTIKSENDATAQVAGVIASNLASFTAAAPAAPPAELDPFASLF